MFLNLFDIFDPTTNNNIFRFNWLSIIIFIIFIPKLYWIFSSRIIFLLNFFSIKLTIEFKNNFSNSNFKSFFLYVSLFWFILYNNILGLYPYIFTATRHLSLSLSLSLSLWLIFILFGWINSYNRIFSHLVPLGTPLLLSSFIVLIETIRNIIRPITLAVRLSANIIAGHLLLSLLSNINETFSSLFIISCPILILLLCLEYAVSIIQSYVFITLLSLYFNEI